MLAWLIDKVRWLLLIAAVGGPALAYFSWSDAERIRDVETNGVEAVALIEGATRTQRRRGGTSYALDLAWKDGKGGVRKAEKVSVSRAFAEQVVKNDKLTRNSLRIKYLRDDATVTPVVVEDASRQEDAGCLHGAGRHRCRCGRHRRLGGVAADAAAPADCRGLRLASVMAAIAA